MWLYKCGRKLSCFRRKQVDDGLPRTDADGKEVTVNYFRDRKDFWMKVAAIFLNLIAGVSIAVFIILVTQLANSLGDGDKWKIWIYLMVLDCLLLGAGTGGATLLSEWSAERQLLAVRRQFLHEVMRQDIGYFDAYDATALSGKLLDNTRVLRNLLGIRSSMAYLYIGIVVACVRQAFVFQTQVAGVSCCVIPVIVIAGWWAGRIDVKSSRVVQAANALADSVALESFEAVRTVKAFNIQPHLQGSYHNALEHAYKTSSRAGVKVGFGYAVYWLLMFCSAGFGFWYGAYFLRDDIRRTKEECELKRAQGHRWPICDDPSSPPELIATFCNVLLSAFFIGKVLPWFADLRAANIAVRETVALYTRKTRVDPFSTEGRHDTNSISGELEFRDIAFSYPSRDAPVFSKLNLRMPAGKSIALVGASGCGKSTVVQLLLRFYNPDAGELLLDGLPITDYNVGALRSCIAWVSQEPKLFAVSLLENVRIGKPDATLAEVIAVCRQANAHEFIEALPEKYDTWVGDGGGQLSGGQKQRIAIARALLRRPKILILDEATSALDNASERVVQDTIDAIVRDSQITTIIIAHRLSTVRQADQIAVFNRAPDGSGSVVAELGTHAELSAIPDGIYAALVAVQQGGHADTEDAEGDKLMRFQSGGGTRISMDEEPLRHGSSAARALRFGTTSGSRLFGSGALMPFGQTASRLEVALPLTRTESIFLNHAYSPPRLFSRTSQPLRFVWPRFTFALLSSMVFNCVWPLFGALLGTFVRVYAKTDDPNGLVREAFRNAMIMIAIGAGGFVSFWLMRTCGVTAAQKIVYSLRSRGYAAVLRQEVGFFDQVHRSPARLAGILTSECQLLGQWVADNLCVWVGTAFSLLFGLVLCLQVDVQLGGVALAIVCVLVPVAYIGSTLVTSGGSLKFWSGAPDDLALLTAELGVQVTDVVLNIRTVTAYQMQEQCAREFDERALQIFATGRRRATYAGLATGVTGVMRLLSFTLLFYYGGLLVEKGQLEPFGMIRGTMAVLLAGLQTGRTLAGTVPWALGKNAARAAWTLLDRQPAIDEAPSAAGRECMPIEKIEFKHVAFKYPTRPNLVVFRDVSFKIERGQSVALVGASGCGKSTSVQLIERFYDVIDFLSSPDHRSGVFFNGIDIRDYRLHSVRSRIGYVPQEPRLFAGTIRENILLGLPEAEAQSADAESRIRVACEQANAWEFIQAQPLGLDTDVGRGGARLSGGQKQRVAIARALIRNPSLLILDEATSALDAESERVVQEALSALLDSKQFTSLVIAHRLSTIRSCDAIVVFTNNAARGSRIAEVGTHEQLLRFPNGVYRNLIRIAEGEH